MIQSIHVRLPGEITHHVHEWVILSHIKQWMWLTIHALKHVNKMGPKPTIRMPDRLIISYWSESITFTTSSMRSLTTTWPLTASLGNPHLPGPPWWGYATRTYAPLFDIYHKTADTVKLFVLQYIIDIIIRRVTHLMYTHVFSFRTNSCGFDIADILWYVLHDYE